MIFYLFWYFFSFLNYHLNYFDYFNDVSDVSDIPDGDWRAAKLEVERLRNLISQVDCNILDDIEEIEKKRTPLKKQLSSQIMNGYSYDDSEGCIIAPPITANLSKQETSEVYSYFYFF